MDTPDQALAFLERQRSSGSTAWHNMCESLARQSYALAAHFSSANLHANAIPSSYRYGHDQPSKGDLALFVNSTYGHIVVCTGNGWECYTNDYGGKGKVTKTDLRNLVSWCNASSWFIADAWWSSSNFIRTHKATLPPTPPNTPDQIGEHEMFLYRTPNGKTAVLVDAGKQIYLDATTANNFMTPLKGDPPLYVQFTADAVERINKAYGPPIG